MPGCMSFHSPPPVLGDQPTSQERTDTSSPATETPEGSSPMVSAQKALVSSGKMCDLAQWGLGRTQEGQADSLLQQPPDNVAF